MLPTPRDKAIVLAVYTHGRLSREQVRRLFFRKAVDRRGRAVASVQATGARLRKLVRAGYLTRVAAPVLRGSSQYLYSLGPIGAKLLAADYGIRVSPPSERRLTAATMAADHGLEIVDFYIALKEALEAAGGRIFTWLGERESAFRFYHRGRKRMIAPDAYCLWSLAGQMTSFFLEWERGHQALSIIAAKLDGYDAYYSRRGYLDHLGEVGLKPRLLLVLPDSRRARQVLGWIRRGLQRGRWRFLPTIFVSIRPLVLGDILGAVWMKPGSADSVRLDDT